MALAAAAAAPEGPAEHVAEQPSQPLAEPLAESGAEQIAKPTEAAAATPAEDLLQWTWADSWALPGAQLLIWSTARSAEELAKELEEAQGDCARPVEVYSSSRSSTVTFASAAIAAKRLREKGSSALVADTPRCTELDFAKPPAITGVGDILSLGALSLTVTTATTLGLALSPVLIAKHVTQVLISNLAAPCMSRNCCATRPLDSSEKLSIDDFRDTDRHWDSTMRIRRREPGNQSMKYPEGTVRRAMYVRMSDGIELAMDILLPPDRGQTPSPCVVQFARYWRSYEIRWPLRGLINDGEPWDFMHGETKCEFLLAGFAWVSVDCRGCGASGGMQNVVWSDREIQDVLEVIDFIVGDAKDHQAPRRRQPWSDGRVGLYGVSYDAGVAMRAAARGHSAVKAVGVNFPFGDIWRELFPGGIMNRWFLETWSEFNRILDNANLGYVHPAAPVAVKGAAPAGPREVHDAMIASHKDNWNLMVAAHDIISIDSEVTLPEGQTITAESLNLWQKHLSETKTVARDEYGESSPEAVFPALAETGLPVLLVSGWLCVTTKTVSQAFAQYSRNNWRLLLGPWNHGGAQHYRYARGSRPMHFAMAADAANFFLQHMPPSSCTPASPSVPRLRSTPRGFGKPCAPDESAGSKVERSAEAFFYIGGAAPGWAHSQHWPPSQVRKRPLWLTAEGTLTPAPPDQSGEARQLPPPTGISGHLWAGNSRYVTMIKAMDPVGYTWQEPPRDTVVIYESGPLEEPVTIVGSPVVSLQMRSTVPRSGQVLDRESQDFLRVSESDLGSAASDSDVFVYLCMRLTSDGPPVYITEGQLRLSYRQEADQPSEVAASDCPVADDDLSQQAAAADCRGAKEPFHTFLSGDKLTLPPVSGEEFRARISLLPVGFRFDAGCSIALVMAADDAAHFAPNPTMAATPGATPPSICHGPGEPSLLWLPILPEPERRFKKPQSRPEGDKRLPFPSSPSSRPGVGSASP